MRAVPVCFRGIGVKIERADRVATVPQTAASENWTAEQAQEWAKGEVLAGGPPDKPIDPATMSSIDWSDVKRWAGKQIRVRARPMGLIVTNATGARHFYPGDATTGAGGVGFAMGMSTKQMRELATVEGSIRGFAQAEVGRYNKKVTSRVRQEERRTATREFWEAGKRIREFITQTPAVIQDRVWFSLEQWGRGESGYGKNWLEYATYFYDWLPDLNLGNPAFSLSETRIMNIIRATKKRDGRQRLLDACLRGPFTNLSDEEFKWITGQSKGTFPLTPDVREEFMALGCKVTGGETLSESDLARTIEIREMLRQAPRKTPTAQEEPTNEE